MTSTDRPWPALARQWAAQDEGKDRYRTGHPSKEPDRPEPFTDKDQTQTRSRSHSYKDQDHESK